jgi:hypothetical protein
MRSNQAADFASGTPSVPISAPVFCLRFGCVVGFVFTLDNDVIVIVRFIVRVVEVDADLAVVLFLMLIRDFGKIVSAEILKDDH